MPTEKQLRARDIPNAQERAQEAYDKYWNLTEYRKNELRKKARTMHLAYGFLRGVPYMDMEEGSYTEPNWLEIEKTAMHYSQEDPRDVAQRFERWMQEAQAFDMEALA